MSKWTRFAAAALLVAATSAHADGWVAIPGSVAPPPAQCDLFMELTGQVLHVVVKSCSMQFDDRLRINSRTPNCSTQLTRIEQTDHVTYLVFFIDSGTDCDGSTHSQRALQFQLVGDDTLRITNTENY